MNNLLKYKGYFAKIEFDAEQMILFGKIEGINDLVTFESEDANKITDEFHSAVDDYLIYCSDIGKEPEKPFKGTFNVRVSPEIHKEAFVNAAKKGISLNAFVANAIEESVKGREKASLIINYHETKATIEAITDFNNRTPDIWDENSDKLFKRRGGVSCAKFN